MIIIIIYAIGQLVFGTEKKVNCKLLSFILIFDYNYNVIRPLLLYTFDSIVYFSVYTNVVGTYIIIIVNLQEQ